MATLPLVLWTLVSLFFAAIIASLVMGFFSGNQMPVDGKTVVITGASEGMGLSAARMLSAKGANLVIVSRSAERLEAALAVIKAAAKHPDQRFHAISADVSKPDFAPPLLSAITAWNGGLPPDIVWCIAGFSTPGIWAEMPLSITRRHMDVNFYGQAELAHAVLNAWLDPAADSLPSASAPKHFIFTTTVAALMTIAGYGSYAPSKWALRGLADSLAQEMLLYAPRRDVRIRVVYPGTILSPGFERETVTKPEITKILEKDDPKQTPDQVAAAAIRGLERGDVHVPVTWLGNLMRLSVLGGSLRNNWVLDFFGSLLPPLIFLFVLPDMLGKIRRFAREYGHPRTYSREHFPRD